MENTIFDAGTIITQLESQKKIIAVIWGVFKHFLKSWIPKGILKYYY